MTIGAFSIILDDRRRVLLCRRTDCDVWNLPGGGVEKKESPWDAAIREALEEVGVRIVIEKLVGIYHKPDQDDLVFQFKSKIVEGTPSISDEASEVRYFHLHELPENTSPRQRERIATYFESPDIPQMRIQTGVAF